MYMLNNIKSDNNRHITNSCTSTK